MEHNVTDAAALGDLAYSVHALAELDHDIGCSSTIMLQCRIAGDGQYGFEVHVATAYDEPDGNVSLLNTNRYLECALVVSLLVEIAQGVTKHAALIRGAVPPRARERGRLDA